MQHGLAEGSWRWNWTTDYIFGTFLLIFPLNFFGALASPKNDFNKVFSFLTWGGFSFFLFSSFKGSVELNWPSIFYPCLFALSVQAATQKILFKNTLYWLAIYILAAVLIFTQKAPSLTQKLNEPLQAAFLSKLPYEMAPLYASTYQFASLLWWSSQKPVYKIRGSGRHDFFDEKDGSFPTESIFYLIKEPGNNLPDWIQPNVWTIQEMQKPDDIHIVLKISKKDSL